MVRFVGPAVCACPFPHESAHCACVWVGLLGGMGAHGPCPAAVWRRAPGRRRGGEGRRSSRVTPVIDFPRLPGILGHNGLFCGFCCVRVFCIIRVQLSRRVLMELEVVVHNRDGFGVDDGCVTEFEAFVLSVGLNDLGMPDADWRLVRGLYVDGFASDARKFFEVWVDEKRRLYLEADERS